MLRRKFGLEWDTIAEAIFDLRTVLDPVRPIDIGTHEAAVGLAGSHGSSFDDAPIVASALEAGCDTLLSVDLRDGRCITGLTIVNPFA